MTAPASPPPLTIPAPLDARLHAAAGRDGSRILEIVDLAPGSALVARHPGWRTGANDVDLRRWRQARDGSWYPTHAGIVVPRAALPEVASILGEVARSASNRRLSPGLRTHVGPCALSRVVEATSGLAFVVGFGVPPSATVVALAADGSLSLATWQDASGDLGTGWAPAPQERDAHATQDEIRWILRTLAHIPAVARVLEETPTATTTPTTGAEGRAP